MLDNIKNNGNWASDIKACYIPNNWPWRTDPPTIIPGGIHPWQPTGPYIHPVELDKIFDRKQDDFIDMSQFKEIVPENSTTTEKFVEWLKGFLEMKDQLSTEHINRIWQKIEECS